MIYTTILACVEKTINSLLPLDPEMEDELAKHNGKMLRLNVNDMRLDVYVRVQKNRVRLSEHYDGEVNATIIGTSTTLLKTYAKGFSVGSGVEVTGDIEFVEDLTRISNQFHIDWEELLSQVVGDLAAHKIHGTVVDVTEWGKDAAERLRQDVSEYVHEEARLAPSREELEDFYVDVSDVRDAVERAEARIKRLHNALQKE